MRMTSKSDIIIIGAGLNGLAAALALGGAQAERPCYVTLVDQYDPRASQSARRDSRGSALTRATQTMFERLGLLEVLKPHLQEMRDVIVTDDVLLQETRPALLSFATPEGEKSAAAMIENHVLLGAMLEAAMASPLIKFETGRAVKDFSFGPGLASVTLDDGTKLRASLIIAADGRNSKAREAAGIDVISNDYGQSAITLTVEHEAAHDALAEEHFTSDGVFAILPLTGNRSSLVWTETHDEAARIAALDDAAFQVELEKRFGPKRGKLLPQGARRAYPLTLIIAKEFMAQRLALVGDAAHVIHPLAGLGLNLGFKDVAALADCVADALAIGADIGSRQVLERYQSSRRFDTYATNMAIDGLNRLFANDNPALKVIRDFGLKMVDRAVPLKTVILNQAAGRGGDLPRLMR